MLDGSLDGDCTVCALLGRAVDLVRPRSGAALPPRKVNRGGVSPSRSIWSASALALGIIASRLSAVQSGPTNADSQSEPPSDQVGAVIPGDAFAPTGRALLHPARRVLYFHASLRTRSAAV